MVAVMGLRRQDFFDVEAPPLLRSFVSKVASVLILLLAIFGQHFELEGQILAPVILHPNI